MGSVTRSEGRQVWLLELQRGESGVRTTLMPLSATTAAVCGYLEVAVDFAEVERLVEELHRQLGQLNARGEPDDAAGDEARKLGHLLFDELLPGPVKAFLRQHDGLDLLLRTDETLADVPWELLHTGEGYLALRYNIGRLLSLEGLTPAAPSRRLASPLDVLIVADPCGDLDAAYEEGLRIRSVLDGQDFLRVTLKTSEVDRTYLRENLREFDLLHFAGHGQVAGRGEGWLLADGRFGPGELQKLVGGRPFPALVFANACASGRAGQQAAMWSMARTCLQAGVRHFIGTHWDVPDAIAGQFAERFYRGMCHGMSVGAALRQARLAMSLVYGHGTILWSAYCLFGDPSHVYFPDAVDRDVRELPELPILEAAPVARRILHTLDPREAVGGGALGPHPSLRSEAVLGLPVRRALLDGRLRGPLLGGAFVAALAGVGLLIAAPWGGSAPLEQPAARPLLSPAPLPAPEAPESTRLAAMLREQEEAEARVPPRLDFDVLAQTHAASDDLVEVRVNEGTRLRSGDSLRLQLKSDRDVYIAVIRLDPHDTPQLLFPHAAVRRPGGNYLAAGEAAALPGSGQWYRLDAPQKGVETLLVVADRQPLTGLDALVEAIARLPRATRGEGMVVKGEPGAENQAGRAARRRRLALDSRARLLGDVSALARQQEIEVIQAVTYLHDR